METLRYVKIKKIKNLIYNILLIIICIIDFFINYDNYYAVLTNNYKRINSIIDINSKSKFYVINMKKAKINNYAFQNSNTISDIYTLNIDNKEIFILMKENTILTNKVVIEPITNDNIINQINSKFNNEFTYYFSNITVNNNIKIELYKVYTITAISIMSLLLGLINIMGIVNLEKTYIYKKLSKQTY